MRDQLVKLVQDRIGDEPVCLYAYDLDQLTEHVRTVVESLPPRCRMFYAMKANSGDRLLRALAPLVAGFEVASGGELAKARAIGADIPVIFGGPAKTPQEIEQALVQGVTRLHAESVLELHRISEAATRLGRTADVLLRVNLAPVPERDPGDGRAPHPVRDFRTGPAGCGHRGANPSRGAVGTSTCIRCPTTFPRQHIWNSWSTTDARCPDGKGSSDCAARCSTSVAGSG
ncbi:alanine racemase [Saccharopolyspora spinosa]|uniref:alanine racemase n=1 Tax=Saccharopolyspora spinosa TaxID=60894 RepID=UPI00376ED7CE